MKNLLLLSLLLAGSTHAIPAPSSPVRQKIGQYITSTSGILPSKERINRLREDTLSSSYGFSKVNEIGGAPITFKFGKTARHQKLRKAPNSGEGDLHKRQSNTSDNESELLNFDNTRYIACESFFRLLSCHCPRHAADLGVSAAPRIILYSWKGPA